MPGDQRGETRDLPLPVTVLGGYLGAGKTTLLNHLLRNAGGRRIAVLVNDFGEIAIDADLIESHDGDVVSLAGGCVCCSIGSDLVGALRSLVARRPLLDHAVIETSGVALPGPVAAAVTLAPDAAVDAIVVVADAATVRERARDRYVGDVVATQLAAADLVVLAGRDRVDASTAASLAGWLGAIAPGAPIIEATHGAVPPEVLLGIGRLAPRPARTFVTRAPDRRFVQASRALDRPHDPRQLAAALAAPALGLLRAKAIVRDGRGEPHLVQLAGNRCEVTPVIRAESPPDERAFAFGLVCIGLRGRINEAAIDAALASSRL